MLRKKDLTQILCTAIYQTSFTVVGFKWIIINFYLLFFWGSLRQTQLFFPKMVFGIVMQKVNLFFFAKTRTK